MLRILPLALAALGLLAASPTAAACVGPGCFEPVVVCQDAIPMMCMEVDPDHLFDATRLDEVVREVIGPCTCDPID